MPAPSIIIEDGTGVATANSYVLLADANTFMNGEVYAVEWNNSDTEAKTRALIAACRMIDYAMTWDGYRSTLTQAMSWPRSRVHNFEIENALLADPLAMTSVYYPDNTIPQRLKDAQCIQALELLRADRGTDPGTMGVNSFTLEGALSVTFDKTDRPLPIADRVQDILAAFGSAKGGPGAVRVIRVP
jgi:hypothetical protein